MTTRCAITPMQPTGFRIQTLLPTAITALSCLRLAMPGFREKGGNRTPRRMCPIFSPLVLVFLKLLAENLTRETRVGLHYNIVPIANFFIDESNCCIDEAATCDTYVFLLYSGTNPGTLQVFIIRKLS